jgi:hypothetical protein
VAIPEFMHQNDNGEWIMGGVPWTTAQTHAFADLAEFMADCPYDRVTDLDLVFAHTASALAA